MPAGDRYVEVPTEAMVAFLRSKGFAETTRHSRREVVYERSHHVDPRYKVLVYTSIAAGRATARARGADAIRVVAIFEGGNSTRGVAKTKRVFRTGTVDGVLARVLERMREAYVVCNQRVAQAVERVLPTQRADEVDEDAETQAHRDAVDD